MSGWNNYDEEDEIMFNEDEYELSDIDRYDIDHEAVVQEVIDQYFGGIPKEEIIAILKEHYPESFE